MKILSLTAVCTVLLWGNQALARQQADASRSVAPVQTHKAVEEYLRLLHSGIPSDREYALESLGAMGRSAEVSVPRIAPLLRDQTQSVRVRSAGRHAGT